ncbi:formylmethionine deformylase [Saccharomonospora piscinae]|uniref:Peptide deformylase n=1 Tax=Saccharomonospora piscinae TaxID=687388 RepID=A0A1V9A6Y2_SACPI|nr:peptide deformylase [Saccharomonospora piscinae]OQO92851.1 formylmethionine deformylase [Saccharomonospora piscinae]TLW92986.1 helix-turn-helix domain-containing protein [Saccharomonospora piscinae]
MPTGTTGPADAEVNVFAVELKRWRDVRGHSRATLAKAMGYDRSYVSKVESGAERPSEAFAAHAEKALRAGGALRTAFRDFETSRPTKLRPPAAPLPEPHAGNANLIVNHDDATLRYENGGYRLTQRRHLVNQSNEPITRYLVRISVDRYPGDPERSNQLYSENPLTWDEIGLRAWHGRNRSNPMNWTAHHDRDAFKEVWLLFAGEHGHFPLYPGESCWIEYEYTVSEKHWGNWFQRAVRLPTRTLSVCLDFPAELAAQVWGLHTSMTAQAMPFATAIGRDDTGDRHVFSWSCEDPPLHARYRLEWHFRGCAATSGGAGPRPSEVMAALGIVQDSNPALRRVARSFELPVEAEDAHRVLTALNSAAERVSQVHTFGKGMGIAAPQIGIDRAAAIVHTPDGEFISLFNPVVIEEAGDVDEQYEGCLSFFDVRGQVPRTQVIHVEHTTLDGRKKITMFERGIARLVAHEVDHLHGHLYTDRMREGVAPIPVEQYRGTGTNWSY